MKLNVERELAALQKMTTAQLGERYVEVYNEAARSRHRTYLIRKIIWRLQALAEGDLSERARRRAEELADDAYVRTTPPRHRDTAPAKVAEPHCGIAVADSDPRLPPVGTAIQRDYKGRTLRVLIQPDGLEYDGQRYKSLSAVAKAITGQHVNGFRFFRLGGTP